MTAEGMVDQKEVSALVELELVCPDMFCDKRTKACQRLTYRAGEVEYAALVKKSVRTHGQGVIVAGECPRYGKASKNKFIVAKVNGVWTRSYGEWLNKQVGLVRAEIKEEQERYRKDFGELHKILNRMLSQLEEIGKDGR